MCRNQLASSGAQLEPIGIYISFETLARQTGKTNLLSIKQNFIFKRSRTFFYLLLYFDCVGTILEYITTEINYDISLINVYLISFYTIFYDLGGGGVNNCVTIP